MIGITLNLVTLTIIFIIGMFIFSDFKWYWNILIPVFIADLSIFIWLVIEWIRFKPDKNVTDKE